MGQWDDVLVNDTQHLAHLEYLYSQLGPAFYTYTVTYCEQGRGWVMVADRERWAITVIFGPCIVTACIRVLNHAYLADGAPADWGSASIPIMGPAADHMDEVRDLLKGLLSIYVDERV
jgi:hypothetical protein